VPIANAGVCYVYCVIEMVCGANVAVGKYTALLPVMSCTGTKYEMIKLLSYCVGAAAAAGCKRFH